MSHYPLPAELAAQTGHYRACFYGHTHVKRAEKLKNGSWLINPGELAGFKTGQASFAIWDAAGNKAEIVDLRNFKVAR